VDALTPEEVARRLSVATDGETVDTSISNKPKTWALTNQVVDNLVGFIRNPSERWYLGFPEIDLATRGVGKGEVLMVVGRSHTGKSQMLLNSIVVNLINDPAAHVVIFSMDEPRELVAMKLFCLLKGRSSTDVEEAIKNSDKNTIEELAEASEKELSRIAIIDESLPLSRMEEVMEETREWFGTNPSFCMIDYLELLPGGDSDATGVTTKAQAVKRWAKTQRVPVGLVHQAGRGSGDKGKAAGLYAGRYGGEQEAIFVIEVYRQRDRYDLSQWEKTYHDNSINLNLCKNKRTARLIDQTYYLDPSSGHVHPYWEELIPDAH
jgi:KaiC/GvpD/RAD55 family RecA-like ATPase|tara:strand:- start:2797 stop:3759 length:963 start_codon:yes stop_codon:yes gene_type:complete